MKTQAQHTPTPWKSDFYIDEAPGDAWKAQILANDNRPAVAYTWGSDRKEVEANAAFIVRAVNNFDSLLDALHYVVESGESYERVQEIAQEAIAKAESQKCAS